MPPEQALGELGRLGPAADVYAVGAMLYHLIAGHMPYVLPGEIVEPSDILDRLRNGAPVDVHALNPDAPAELVAICERAMSREPSQRYADMSSLATDLRAYLEHRVVDAYETGALAELRKWVSRNRLLASSLAAVGLLLIVSVSAFAVLNGFLTDLTRELSDKNEDLELALASAETERQSADASARLAERKAEEARIAADSAAREEQVARGERDNVLRLSAFRELEALQAEADALWPAVPERVAAYDEWLKRAHVLLSGLYQSNEGTGIGHIRQLEMLRERALPLSDEDRLTARLAHPRFAELQSMSAELASSVEAVAAFREGLGGMGLSAEQQVQLSAVDEEIARARVRRDKLEAEISVAITPAPQFASNNDAWWYDQVERLVQSLGAFANPQTGMLDGISEKFGWGIRKRRDFAATIEERTINGPGPSQRWVDAIASIADRTRSPAYGGLHLAPQLGLLPIGRDPESGLWEFWHVQSGAEPERDGDGKLVLEDEMGIVLVLVPSGHFWMGSQKDEPTGRNYDPGAKPDEGPVHEVSLSPYFLSKFEMTQAQWVRTTGVNPSRYSAERHDSYWSKSSMIWDNLHPVEYVSWEDCELHLSRLGLSLPSEAQWEFACRAGTDSVFWSGNDVSDLEGVANLADQYAHDHGLGYTDKQWESTIDDGEVVHARVGSYRANAFGLHDTLGNLWEWCADGYDTAYYANSPMLDPCNETPNPYFRVLRGGSFANRADAVTSAVRFNTMPDDRDLSLGVRPARAINP